MEGICYIVGAGENYGIHIAPEKKDLVIAVDGGYDYLEGVCINLVVGDFDSLGRKPEHPHVIELTAEKDDTDMMVALREGLDRGYGIFKVFCGTGGRLAHTVANLECLAFLAANGAHGFLYGKEEITTMIQDEAISFEEISQGYISVFSHTNQSEGVTIKGLKYELDEALLLNTIPLGISNEFIGKRSTIAVKKGTLLILYPMDSPEPVIYH